MVKLFSTGILVLITIYSAFAASSARGGASRVAKEELIPAVLIVKNLGKADIEVIFRKNNAFLPLLSIFRNLNLKTEFSSDRNTVSGFYPDSRSSFFINLTTGDSKTRDTSISLTSDIYTFSDDELYLREDLFRSLFKLDIRYLPRRLEVVLVPPKDLPIFAAKARDRMRQRSLGMMEAISSPEYSFSRQPSLFEMGKLNWSLSNLAEHLKVPRSSYDARLGGKILFGDLDLRIRGIFNKKIIENNIHGDLTYPFVGQDYLGEIRFGDVQPAGLSQRGILGFEVTNRPAARRIVFGTEQYETKLDSSAEFEFYSQGRLTNFYRSTSENDFRTSYPLYYGIGEYETRIYNQWGELSRQQYRTVVPQTMLPTNVFQYSIVGGKIRNYNQHYGDISLGYGVTPALTLGGGSEFYEQGFAKHEAIPFVTGTTRFTSSLTGYVFVSPLAVSNYILDLNLPNQNQVTLSQYVYANDPAFNLGGLIGSTDLYFNFPLPVKSEDFNIGGYASNSISNYSHQRSFLGTFGAHFPSLQLLYTYYYSQSTLFTDTYQTTVNQSSLDGSTLAPAQVVVHGDITYDHLRNEVRSINLGLNKIIFHNLFLQLSYQRNFDPSYGIVLLQINYNLPFLRFFSSTIHLDREGTDMGTLTTNTASGAVFFSTKTGSLMFNGLQHADRGAILMNAYVDHNDNGQRDPGEELLPDVKFKAYSPRVASTATYTPKGLLLTNIEPYQDYIATIDQKNVFEDPLYIPKYQTISITGEPNILKVVEFPVLVGGNVHGTILLKRSNGSPTPVEGIPVTIRAKSSIKEIGAPKPYTKTIKTFSTGEIQFVTVPPGTYEVFIDPTDLNLYGFKTTQSSREITVSAKPEGDQIDGVDFMLERQ